MLHTFEVRTGNKKGTMYLSDGITRLKIQTVNEGGNIFGIIIPKDLKQQELIMNDSNFLTRKLVIRGEKAKPSKADVIVEKTLESEETAKHPFMMLFNTDQHKEVTNTLTSDDWNIVRDNILEIMKDRRSTPKDIESFPADKDSDAIVTDPGEKEREKLIVELNEEVKLPDSMNAHEQGVEDDLSEAMNEPEKGKKVVVPKGKTVKKKK
ncbi:MAG: hypothetical protein WC358_07010 [Ignavibacteria bacterium]|jgi:hypothetical protein